MARKTVSCRMHDALFSDMSQSLCSRAYWRREINWTWRVFCWVIDFVFWPFQRNHCQRSHEHYHAGKTHDRDRNV